MANFKWLILFLVLFFIPVRCLPHQKMCVIDIITQEKGRVSCRVEIADDSASRRRGLMFRKTLPRGQGMLFVFSSEKMLNFWMKNTLVPLDIAYISGTGVINEIHPMKPRDTSVTYPSKYPARYALEVNQGWFAEQGITKGALIEFNGCISK